MRYFIEISYNGKNYHGWQKQPNAISIQEKLETSLSLILKQKIELVGCGRTDAGVHASQFFAHFDVREKLEEPKLLYKINAFLPDDIVIHRFILVNDNAHVRFDANLRSYEYRIYLGRNPFFVDTTWQVPNKEFNIFLMNEASKVILEYSNFKSFSRSKTDVKTYECDVQSAFWELNDNFLTFHITANRFLRNMVRAIVGTLIEIGYEKKTIEDFRSIIESEDRTKAGMSVKAHGLFLTKVTYPYLLE